MKKLNAQQRNEFLDTAAMMAMQGIVAGNRARQENVAYLSYDFAQALLAERDRRSEEK